MNKVKLVNEMEEKKTAGGCIGMGTEPGPGRGIWRGMGGGGERLHYVKLQCWKLHAFGLPPRYESECLGNFVENNYIFAHTQFTETALLIVTIVLVPMGLFRVNFVVTFWDMRALQCMSESLSVSLSEPFCCEFLILIVDLILGTPELGQSSSSVLFSSISFQICIKLSLLMFWLHCLRHLYTSGKKLTCSHYFTPLDLLRITNCERSFLKLFSNNHQRNYHKVIFYMTGLQYLKYAGSPTDKLICL